MAKKSSPKTVLKRGRHPKSLHAKQFVNFLRSLKLVIVDVDGVLTDARIFWQDGYGWSRYYNVRDGFGLAQLMRNGVQVGVISAGNSPDITHRMEHLKIPHVYMGNEDKTVAFREILSKTGFKREECVFIADELFDLPVLREVGLAVTVPEAPVSVKKEVHYVTSKSGGFGAVREVADAILAARGVSI